MADACMEGTNVTIEFLEKVILDDCNEKGKLESWESEQIAKGEGFMSVIVRVDLHWDGTSSKRLPNQVIIKTPMQDNFKELLTKIIPLEMLEAIMSSFNSEMLKVVYTNEIEALRFLSEGRDDTKVPRLIYAKDFIDENDQGYVVIESMVGQCCLQNLCDGFSLEQTKSVIRALAAVQAKAIKDPSWQQRNISGISEKSIDQMGDMMEPMKTKVYDLDERLREPINQIDWIFAKEYGKKFWKKLETPYLVHGDMHGNNLLFRKDAHGKASDELIGLIDWQIAHPGCVMEDLCRLLIIHLDPDMRHAETDNLLQLYLDTIKQHLGNHPCPLDMPQLKRMWMQYFPHGTMCVVCIATGEFRKDGKGNLFWVTVMFATMVSDMPQIGGTGEVRDVRVKKMVDRALAAAIDCNQLEEEHHVSTWFDKQFTENLNQ